MCGSFKDMLISIAEMAMYHTFEEQLEIEE